jgi:hypothetical protein
MRQLRLAIIKAAGFVVALVGAGTTVPANAAPLLVPNGSFDYNTPGTNSVNTGNIAATTTSLTIGSAFPGSEITSFIDPFLGNPNNFCGSAGAGCTGSHAPGFLGAGGAVVLSNLTLPVGNGSPVPFTETVTAENSTATANVDFDFTSISTTTLIPATSTSVGSLTLDFLGTFASDSTGQYALGEPADMTITCSQPATGQSITCNGTVGTPVSSVFEPGSLALFGSALFGLVAIHRRKAA